MISFNEEERKTIITLNGDKGDYTEILQTLVFMLGNQKEDHPLTAREMLLMTNLIGDMLPDISCLR